MSIWFWLIILILVLAFDFILLLWWQNGRIVVDEYEALCPTLPEALDGCRIVHLADLHDRLFGQEQAKLSAALKRAKPDLILISGDFINRKTVHTAGAKNALAAIQVACEYAPVFFVGGNNEWQSGVYEDFQKKLAAMNVEVLENDTLLLGHDDASLLLMGLADVCSLPKEHLPADYRESYFYMPDENPPELLQTALELMCKKGPAHNCFRVLLTHRPQWMNAYNRAGVDLMLCGHAHGGQVRLPWIGGLFAPQQGFFPKYTSGGYIVGNMLVFITRGLGNNGIPCRLFNDPQVQVITLRSDAQNPESP